MGVNVENVVCLRSERSYVLGIKRNFLCPFYRGFYEAVLESYFGHKKGKKLKDIHKRNFFGQLNDI